MKTKMFLALAVIASLSGCAVYPAYGTYEDSSPTYIYGGDGGSRHSGHHRGYRRHSGGDGHDWHRDRDGRGGRGPDGQRFR